MHVRNAGGGSPASSLSVLYNLGTIVAKPAVTPRRRRAAAAFRPNATESEKVRTQRLKLSERLVKEEQTVTKAKADNAALARRLCVTLLRDTAA
jgi:hypothetical protein